MLGNLGDLLGGITKTGTDIFGGAVEGASDISKGIGEFARDNPELAGLITGAITGGQVGEGLLGAGSGLLRGASVRSLGEANQRATAENLRRFQLEEKRKQEEVERKRAAEFNKLQLDKQKQTLAEEKFEFTKGIDKAPKPQQFTDAIFAKRMTTSSDIIEGIMQAGFDPTTIFGSLGGSIPTRTQSDARKRYDQATENWISANLRKLSGAAITPEEYIKDRTIFFPVAGDPPEVIEQKAQSRKIIEEGLKASSGKAYNQIQRKKKTIKELEAEFGVSSNG